MKNAFFKVVIFFVIILINNYSFATCLDYIPNNNNDLKIELEKAQSQLTTDQYNEKLFKEIAQDTQKNFDLARTLAFGGFIPLTSYLSLSLVSYLSATGFGFSVPKLITQLFITGGIVVGPTAINSIFTVKKLLNYFKKENLNENDIKEIISEFKNLDSNNCSFQDARDELDDIKNEILKKIDNRSTIIDRLSLGYFPKKSTQALYATYKLKTIISEMKINELKKYKKYSPT